MFAWIVFLVHLREGEKMKMMRDMIKAVREIERPRVVRLLMVKRKLTSVGSIQEV